MYTDVNVIVDFVDGRKIFFFDKLLILNLCNRGNTDGCSVVFRLNANG